MRALTIPALIAALAAGGAAAAQDAPALARAGASSGGASVPFDFEHDSSLPVEITSDALALDQAARTAVFTGTVKVGQGELRLAADRLEVYYAEGAEGRQGGIERMDASGNVTLSNGAEAAEARHASYVVTTGIVEMDGDVLLTQGSNALASERLRLDLNAGTGTLEGRVKTIIVPGEVKEGAP
ncbi:LptA/OstA family protein [Amaricoccus sp.]|uniref:LptA/OstA family protein n=1 Tax=Amaricoccus sp. TaxID=1872485 RepID=UPI001B70E759|nr:LptA/OstA family protein [Amaricoccus sp.]MBP7242872.1 lipopolysaccharide transport periplasmic protein LptA [Amaricoccus sp.]